MEIAFTKTSDEEHSVGIRRLDGSEDSAVLNSRSFLRHDLAHLAVEMELAIARGYWGSVAAGASLKGLDIRGSDIVTAESLAGPMQTLLRIEADTEKIFSVLGSMRPDLVTMDIAVRIWERGRKLQGHWKATPYGSAKLLEWDDVMSGT